MKTVSFFRSVQEGTGGEAAVYGAPAPRVAPGYGRCRASPPRLTVTALLRRTYLPHKKLRLPQINAVAFLLFTLLNYLLYIGLALYDVWRSS